MTAENFELAVTALHWTLGGLLTFAIAAFIWQFFVPGMRAGRQLKLALKRLTAIKASGPVLDLDHVRSEVMTSDTLRHCWDEYRDTLHAQKQANAAGMMEVARWRATARADGFFTDQALVEAPLRTEFYKHLPGILTGLGIIGTFSGLILGLQGFRVSDDATVVRGSLETLIVSVGGAFVISGIAIALAMVVTTIEKLIVNGRYTQLEALCRLIDSLYDTGVGEEYLQRLVDASETSATQALQMKESLVTDLKQVLTELTQQQIATMTATSAQLGQSIATSLTDGLTEPLARISNAVQAVGSSQGEAVNKLLTDVLSGFTAQMESMFGSQMRGMNEMLVQTASTIQTASQSFERLAGQIQQAGSGAADAMAKRMDEAVQQMQLRQAEANDQMHVFIDQIKDNVAKGQSESADLTMGMMKELSEATSALVEGLQLQAHSAQEAHVERQAEIAGQARGLLDEQGVQVAELTRTVQQASAVMRESVERLQAATNSNVERMGLGAERLQGASNRLSENLDVMKAASDGLGSTADKLNTSGVMLNSSLTATQQALGEQKSVRDALATMVADLRGTVEVAKREASMTSELVDSLQGASQRLTEAQRTAETYLQGVTDVMGEAHGAFAKQMEITMREGNKVFHEELAHATGLLKGAIQELGDVLDALPAAA